MGDNLAGVISIYGVGAYEVIRQAILNRQQVSCVYRGLVRHCCPHAIGTKNDVPRVLMFQFGGQTAQGLPLGGEWRCMDVEEVSQVAIMNGRWQGGPAHSRPRSCIDRIDLEAR